MIALFDNKGKLLAYNVEDAEDFWEKAGFIIKKIVQDCRCPKCKGKKQYTETCSVCDGIGRIFEFEEKEKEEDK